MLTAALLACIAIDGDTLKCRLDNGTEERIRLLGIDAPEMKNCRVGRVCVEGDPIASKATLANAIKPRAYRIERVGLDRYGRTLGVVWSGRVNLNCRMIEAGAAQYVAKWDNGRRVARYCGL